MKYIVFRSKTSPGGVQCKYCFFDLIDIDPNKKLKTQTRKHAYRAFYEMGASAKTMREDVSSYKKNIKLKRTNAIFCKNIIVWEHTKTSLLYVPITEFSKFDIPVFA